MTAATDVVIVDAVRTPFGRRNGALAGVHAIDLLGQTQAALFARTGYSPADVGQVIGGCVSQVGTQSMNVTRTAWLTAGLDKEIAATTVNNQCGSGQQALNLAFALIAAGVVQSAVACGVETMSRVPLGSTTPKDPDAGKPINRHYWDSYEWTSQFEGAERIAEKWDISRADADAFGVLSQQRAAAAWTDGRFDTQILPVALGPDSKHERDEGLRETDLAALAGLRPVGRPDGVHTAGTSSQIADGASAVLLMARSEADAHGLTPLASIVETNLVGCDPVLMLEGPIPATERLLSRQGLSVSDLDVVEINEAFASVVLAWARHFDVDPAEINVNGGAIATGHPLGATGPALIAKATHELIRTGGDFGLVTMCCGGGLGTGTLLRREASA